MSLINARTAWPVLLLHNLDPAWEAADIDEALRQASGLELALGEEGHPVTTVPVDDERLAAHLREHNPDEYVVFNWCEALPGLPRSDALVVRTLDALGFTYTGPTAAALALSWDKPKVKRLLDRQGLPTPHWRLYDSLQPDGWHRFPAIVKPAQEHCSYGVTAEAVVLTPQELQERVAYVLGVFQQPALVEDFIDGREFHVSLWGDGAVEMMPPAEMDFAAFADLRERLCTYDSKFTPGSRHYEHILTHVPAWLDEAEYEQLERTALATFRLFGCRDCARLDIRLRDGVFYVLDVNPNPDSSAETSTAAAAEAAGYSYGAMISRLIDLAARRHPVFGAGRH